METSRKHRLGRGMLTLGAGPETEPARSVWVPVRQRDAAAEREVSSGGVSVYVGPALSQLLLLQPGSAAAAHPADCGDLCIVSAEGFI